MTKSVNPPPSPEPQKLNLWRRLFNQLKSSPKRVAGGAVAIAALGSLGYWGTQVLVKKKLPPFLETEIGKIIERPIELGEVKGFSLNSIELGKTVIPPTASDPDQVTVEGVKVGFNIFPVLFRRTIPLDVALIQPKVYLEQEKNGEWINLDFLASDPDQEKKDPLIYLDLDLDIEEADITAVPYQQKPLQAQVDGTGSYDQKKEIAEYDLDATIERAKAKIQGETKLKIGSTNTKLLVENLALADAATLLPIPVTIDRGILNADLDVNIPSLEEITDANVKGKVSLQDLAGEATNLNAPITAESQLNFGGRNAEVEQTQATLGDITAQINGKVNLDTGYDLNVSVLPFQLASIPKTLVQQLPLDLEGEVEALVKLRGEITDPQLTGKINNTQTVTVAQTPLRQVNADFSGNLEQIVLEDVQIAPVAGGAITAQGTVQTNLRQAFDNRQPLDLAQMPLQLSFSTDLPTQKLIAPYYQLPQPVTVGDFQGQGQIEGTVENPAGTVTFALADSPVNNPENIAGTGELVLAQQNLQLQDTKITYGEGEVDVTANANLENKDWQTNVEADDLNLRPFAAQFSQANLNLDLPLAVKTAKANFNGNLEQLELDQIQGDADLDLNVNGGDVVVTSQLNSGSLQAEASTSNIALNSFIASIPVAASLRAGSITATAEVEELLAKEFNPNSLTADADLDLLVDGSAVTVNSQIDSGQLQAQANTNQIDLNRVAPNLPLTAQLRSSQVTASGELQQLLNFADNPSLSTFTASADADLNAAEGKVKAIANLRNNQWQVKVDGNNISSQLLLEEFAPDNLASLNIDNINAQADLAGNIQPLLNNEVNFPITVNQVVVNSGTQNLQAQGDLTLANLTSNLDVAQSNLDIVANLDFDRLPINQLVTSATQNNELIAQSVNIGGKANFKGQFSGQQLLSAPGEKISLTGDVSLSNFAFNNIAFDPVMTGRLNLQPQQELALQLQGEQDIIAARAVPCRTADCKLPYLPTNLELRQGEDTAQPVIALGERNGDRFALDIDNFPLALLNLAPGRAAGIEGALDGTATGAVDLNLSTLAAAGDITVDNPGLGYIQADRFNADFDYDPDQNIAAINSAFLELERSQYDLNAALDLATGKIDGKLNIPQAYIQDLLQTLRWFTIEDVVSLFNTPEYGAVSTVQPDPIKDVVDLSLARKLNQLRQVNNQIQANAAAREAAGVPTELDIQGQYTGEVILGGTIQVPEADFRVEGNNWQWQPNPAFADIVNPLGLIIEESQFISLPKLLVDGNLQGTTVDLAEARIELQEAALSLKGKLDPQQADASFEVANLTVDNISKFVEIPVDLAGEINSVGTIQGTLEQPQLQGEVTFSDGAFNGNVLPEELAGDFSYNGSQLDFQTTTPQSIQVEATVPYPIIPGTSDRLTAKANLESEAFVFLAALSQNYLNWTGGGGDVELEATGRLDLERKGVLYDLAAEGVVNLDQANVLVETPFFTETFVGKGKITLENQIVNVETLDATFADKDLSVTGKLPILTPVSGLDNPLNIKLPPGDIEIDKLYKGGVEGQVLITGASLEPVIGGEVTLEDGVVFIPQAQTPTTEDAVKIVKAQVADTTSGASSSAQEDNKPNESSGFVTTLNDFQVNLQNFKLRQTPLYNFQLAGGLNLNGTLDQPSNIIPQGKLELTRADVNLFSTRFNLARDRDNTIIFTPEAGVLNPALDIVLRTAVEDVDTGQVTTFRSVETSANEIEDPVSDNDNSNTIRIRLTVDGEAAEILPSLGNSASSGCNIRSSSQPLVENEQYYTEAELNRYTQCFADSFSISSSDRSLIDSTAVSLTSTPSLNQGEIIGLLSNQFIGFAEELSTRSQSELFDLGVERFVLNPLFDRALYRVEDTTVAWGRKIGLDYLTIYPDLEGIYELDQNSSLRLTFTHNLLNDVVEVINDSDDDIDTSSNEIRLEYQRNF